MEKFGYYRDYQLSIDVLENVCYMSNTIELILMFTVQRPREESQHVLLMLDPMSNEFTYADISHRLQLKKIKQPGEEKRRRGAIVRRRELSDMEMERRNVALFEVGGLYDESLNDDEHVREHKRRRAEQHSDAPVTTERHTQLDQVEDGNKTPPPDNEGNSPAVSDSGSE